MDYAHHIDRSRHHLGWVPIDLAAGDYNRAAKALARAASHAVTAAAMHWKQPFRNLTRRRLNMVLFELRRMDQIDSGPHLRTLRQVYRLPADLADADSPAAARRLIRRSRMRVRRLREAIVAAVAGRGKPPKVPDWVNFVLHDHNGKPLSPLEAAVYHRPELAASLRKLGVSLSDPPDDL